MTQNEFVQPLNTKITNLAPDGLTGFQKQVRDIPDLLRLTFGEPGFDVDENIKEAVMSSIANNNSHYADAQGERDLRQAAAAYYSSRYDLPFDDETNVIVTVGASEAINVIFMTLLNDNEGLMIPEPAYAPYTASLDLAHGQKITVNTRPTNFKLTPELVAQTVEESDINIKAVLFNYPVNPTGVTYTRDELEALADIFKKYHLWVISDEIYAQLTYDQEHVSMASLLPEQSILMTGLSKSHAMTGYRIGFIIADKAFVDQAQKVHEALTFALPKFIQDGATVALTKSANVAEGMREIYKKRRDWMVPQLEAFGFEIVPAEGAFYIFAKIPADMNQDSEVFALDLAENGHVAVIPGAAFSEFTPEYIRISYAASDEDLQEAIRRMNIYFDKKRANK